MQLFLQWMFTNAMLTAALTPLALLVARFTRSPGLAYAFWLIVLLKVGDASIGRIPRLAFRSDGGTLHNNCSNSRSDK